MYIRVNKYMLTTFIKRKYKNTEVNFEYLTVLGKFLASESESTANVD